MIAEALKAFNWATERIDQVSKFIKKKVRENEVKKINEIVDSGNDPAIADRLRKIERKAEGRKDA